MSLYEFLLFVHILAAAVWFGAGVLLQVQASRADAVSDDAGLQRVIDDSVWLATRLFIPASLIVLLAGLGLVAEGDWSLGSLWLVLGLLKLLALARIDYVVLILVIADMAIKPSGDDVGLLLVMAAALVAGAVYTMTKANAIPRPATT